MQSSRKISFQGQKNPQKYKKRNKIIPCKAWNKYPDLSCLQNFCGVLRIPNGFKVSFFPTENLLFPILINKYLKLKEIEYLIHYVEFQMWPVLFYVNFLYFQQLDVDRTNYNHLNNF